MISCSLVDSTPALDVVLYAPLLKSPSDELTALVWQRGSDGPVVALKWVKFEHDVVVVSGTPLQKIEVSWTPCNYGGERPWLVCSCGRRVRKLRLGGWGFSCRQCLGLSQYASQYKNWGDRALSHAQDIRVRLGGTANMSLPFPQKPRGMHQQTHQRLKGEDARYQGQWAASMDGFLDRLGAGRVH